jgi:hypothetical protein
VYPSVRLSDTWYQRLNRSLGFIKYGVVSLRTVVQDASFMTVGGRRAVFHVRNVIIFQLYFTSSSTDVGEILCRR